MNPTTNKTAAKVREELAALDRAIFNASGVKYIRWESVTRCLEAENFPYELVQTCKNDIGEVTRYNFYYWRNRSWNDGALYINETAAGRTLTRGVRNALANLREVLALNAR